MGWARNRNKFCRERRRERRLVSDIVFEKQRAAPLSLNYSSVESMIK